MGGFIARQPNGLYCRFSTIVDTLTHWNMTKEDYIDYCVERAIERARDEAEDVLKRYLHDFSEVVERFSPNNNTQEEFNEIIKECTIDQKTD